MYYPESDIIVTKYPEFTEQVEAIDTYLAERNTRPFYMSQAADQLGINLNRVDALLLLLRQYGVVNFQSVWLCPQDNQEITRRYSMLLKRFYGLTHGLWKTVISGWKPAIPLPILSCQYSLHYLDITCTAAEIAP